MITATSASARVEEPVIANLGARLRGPAGRRWRRRRNHGRRRRREARTQARSNFFAVGPTEVKRVLSAD